MIKQPNELTFNDKKFSMIIYGSPGLGKTTLALSAPDPLLIDFDRGISRVKAYHRKATIVCDTYEEVLSDLKSPEIKDFQTIIIDTGGSFVTYLQDWAMRQNPANQQRGGGISQKGFGAVKQEFSRFTNQVRDVLNKNIIYVFHSDEQKDKDGNQIQRLQCEGSSRNLVWQPCDLGAYMQMIGNQRILSFTPQQEFFAKGCYGITGQRLLPEIGMTDKNDFLTKLFEEARANINEENEVFAPIREQYENVMAEASLLIGNITTLDELNEAVTTVQALEHALTSKKESSAMLNEKAKSLGFIWDSTSKSYISRETKNV